MTESVQQRRGQGQGGGARRGVGGRRRCHIVQVANRCSAPTPVCRNASAHVHSHSTGGGSRCSCMALCVATAHPHLAAATRYLAVCTAARCYRRQNAVVRCCRARVAHGSAAPPHSLLHGGGLLPRLSRRLCGAAAELSTRQHGAAAQILRQHGPAVVLTRQRGPAAIGKGGFPVAPCRTKIYAQRACEDPALHAPPHPRIAARSPATRLE